MTPKSEASIKRPEIKKLTSFNEIWYKIFLYCLATVVLMHCVAALISLRALRKHRHGRYLPVVIAIFGLFYPLLGGVISSCCIAWIYSAANYEMDNYFAFIYGAGQAFFVFLISFIRVYGTL